MALVGRNLFFRCPSWHFNFYQFISLLVELVLIINIINNMKKKFLFALVALLALGGLLAGQVAHAFGGGGGYTWPQITTFTISESVFSPNGDGVKDSTSVDLGFSKAVWVHADIFNSAMSKVKDFYSPLYPVQNPDPRIWDGKDSRGNIVPDGVYHLKVGISDGVRSDEESKNITIDTEVPVIAQPANMTVEAISAAGATVNFTVTANDNVDGNFAATCSPASGSTFPLGDTTVTCNASDRAGNNATPVTFTVTVQDKTAPVITLKGSDEMDVRDGDSFTDPGALVTDNVDEDREIVGEGTVDTNTVGTYTLTYNAVDAAGNIAKTVTRLVRVVDVTIPIIHLEGMAEVTAEAGQSYADAGFSVTDDVDADLGGEVVVTVDGIIVSSANDLDTSALCTRYIDFDVSDSAGNAAHQVTRTVNVVDTIAPVITLGGENPTRLLVGGSYVEYATVADSFDPSPKMDISGEVNTNIAGTSTITYTATDASNNRTIATREVIVREIGTDATLSDLKVDGVSVAGFDPATLSYEVVLPFDATTSPEVAYAISDPFASAVFATATDVTSTSTVDRTTTITVTAEDGETTQTYTILFTRGEKPAEPTPTPEPRRSSGGSSRVTPSATTTDPTASSTEEVLQALIDLLQGQANATSTGQGGGEGAGLGDIATSTPADDTAPAGGGENGQRPTGRIVATAAMAKLAADDGRPDPELLNEIATTTEDEEIVATGTDDQVASVGFLSRTSTRVGLLILVLLVAYYGYLAYIEKKQG